MKYFNEDDQYIKAECECCGKVLKVKRECTQVTSGAFNLTPPIRCFCGNIHNAIYGLRKPSADSANNEANCPKCHSTSIAANKKGFGLKKSLAGGFLFGPVGLLSGFWNSNDVKVTCLKCGHKWNV